MTNFEDITQDERELALWLSGGRMDCDMCPVEKQCGEGKSCFGLILDWLKSEA
jgi:hypothetical protein